MVLLVLWTRRSAAAKGTATKRVTCTQCGTGYGYALEREAIGHGWTLYAFDLDGAQDRAEKRAHAKLARRLKRGLEVVPCPKCGWIQEDMVRLERQGHRRWMDTAGWFTVLIAVAAALLNAASATGAPPRRVLVPWVAVAAVAAAGAVLVAVRHALAAAHDPNDEPPEERIAAARARALTAEDLDRREAEQRLPPL